MSNSKIKLADIALLAGVSKSTVSFVLNGHAEKHRITAETVEKVQRIVREHNYAPSLYARALKSKKTFTVGLIIPDLTNMGFASIAKSLEFMLGEAGYQLLIASSNDDIETEKKAVHNLIERQVDILLVASAMSDDHFYRQLNRALPIILFDRVFTDSAFINIKTDAQSATEEVVSHLIKQNAECIFIGGQLALSPSQDRLAGYQAAFKSAHMECNPQWLFCQDYQADSGYAMMAQAVDQLGRVPKAVFTASYSLLEGVLRYLSEHQLLNDSVRLATFDHYAILDCLPIKIDSIEQDSQALAQALFDNALAQLDCATTSHHSEVIAAKVHYRTKPTIDEAESLRN
ncbi:LacI family DNA-binding transcriptional regulator [Vibrio renipiscarius]|uniref:Autoinducer 2-binding periplasmic protein LuxP n=1 Tax=Vibrio renipiscarius TaxID=1461322 RepID=A0A0C2NH32_9VIBR|nr:LacI family DNA-binding transcriptional regulator [Vibrio renipiscarius]KII75620.1 sucrose operon repressor [Vibrio renipiscarius]KII81930.1 sucrose operon repressor [Vibrio renipiscarius]